MLNRVFRWRFFIFVFLVGTLSVGAWWAYQVWRNGEKETAKHAAAKPVIPEGSVPVKLSPQARKNLGLISKPIEPTTYWRTLEIPGAIVDWPGVSDRGVVAPVTGIVTRIYAFPGDTVTPNAPLFAVRLVSESLHASQLELFKATSDIAIAEQQRKRLEEASQSGALAQSRMIEIENQIQRLEVTVKAYEQDLQSRGLPAESIEAAAKGNFVTEINVRAPGEQALRESQITFTSFTSDAPQQPPFRFEMQELKVELGQQVEAGELLCVLADHRALYIEGKGFKDDMALVHQAAKNNWDVAIDFDSADLEGWPPLPEKLRIHHVANVIDHDTRTFSFFLALENQWQAYTQEEEPRFIWRFRPGDRVRLHVAVEELKDVFVLPNSAVVREGPEAYVFRQNGDLFDRRPVHVLHEDRENVVVANDGSLRPRFYIAQSAAASLNRVMKAQSSKGLPAGFHVHADGTVHEAH